MGIRTKKQEIAWKNYKLAGIIGNLDVLILTDKSVTEIEKEGLTDALNMLKASLLISKEDEPKWKQGNGSIIKVKDMTYDHILNCMNCIQKDSIRFKDQVAKNKWLTIFRYHLKQFKL